MNDKTIADLELRAIGRQGIGASKNQLPRAYRHHIFQRDNWKCWYCGVPIQSEASHQSDTASVDHLLPQIKGGGHDLGNLVAACFRCNSQKRDRTLEEHRLYCRYVLQPEGQAITHLRAALHLAPTRLDSNIQQVIDLLEAQLPATVFYGEVAR